ncbi:hypothetical protein QN277_020875 [Acacia crassicarpa]|uniref:Uncharacterized protein n=1 Tax=Acacia crassicarpa TaxID=499986 RepID=A0AAE1KDQ7_9FABA|nr:hypothetical protein QN277_020875 [Acacia crassicarpa]
MMISCLTLGSMIAMTMLLIDWEGIVLLITAAPTFRKFVMTPGTRGVHETMTQYGSFKGHSHVVSLLLPTTASRWVIK